MSTTTHDFLGMLACVRTEANEACSELTTKHGDELEAHRLTIQHAVRGVVEDLETRAQECCPDNDTCRRLVKNMGRYVDWLQWSLWDLPHLAFALKLDEEALRTGVSSCGMVYLSMRMFDDVIDRHHSYKGRGDTLLGLSHANRRSGQSGDALAVLGAMLLFLEGLGRIAEGDHKLLAPTFRALIKAARRTALGAAMELSTPDEWSREFYDRLIVLKNVEFWRTLYAGLDPTGKSPLLPVWMRYYKIAQLVNDVQDLVDDERRGQPNVISITRSERAANSGGEEARSFQAVEVEIANEFCEIWNDTASLPPREQLVARAKIADALSDAIRAGLFKALEQHKPAQQDEKEPAALEWYADVSEVVTRFGVDALVERDCAVCGSSERHFLFKKQGFAFYRCQQCTHIYVTPRARPDISGRLGDELDQADHESPLMDVQKLISRTVCTLLRARAPGSRLLDIGFGRGYIIELARTYGFEVYGVEASSAQLAALHERIGRNLHHGEANETKLPWGNFDAVIMSHVLEHLDEPSAYLKQVYDAMNPEGVLYLAVPDMGSVQFQLFGKNWEPVSPLAHLQYFNRDSLERLLTEVGFEAVERVEQVSVPDEIAPRWMLLLRSLGGTDSGELAILARRPAQ